MASSGIFTGRGVDNSSESLPPGAFNVSFATACSVYSEQAGQVVRVVTFQTESGRAPGRALCKSGPVFRHE